MLISSFYIEIYTGNEKQTIFNYVTSTLKLSAKEIRKRRKEKFHKDILDKLEKKYGEKFVIMSEYDGDVPFGDLQQYVVVRTQDDSHRFRVQVDFDTYSIYGDTYMAYYLYPKYEKYIKKILYDEYGEDVTLGEIQIYSASYLDINITKDTPIEKINTDVLYNMYPNIYELYLNEVLLKNSTYKEEVYKIARLLGKNKIKTGIFIYFMNKDKYHYNFNLNDYNYYEMEGEKYIEFNKEYFVFFSKNFELYRRPFYQIYTEYDYNKNKFYISDVEENFLKDDSQRKKIYID